MKQTKLSIKTNGRGYILITDQVNQAIKELLNQVDIGLLHVFLQHSSASITINENADFDTNKEGDALAELDDAVNV